MIGSASSTPRAAVVALFRNKTRRAILFTILSIPGALLMAAWKAAVFVITPSLFLMATVLFAVGSVVAKSRVVAAHVSARRRESAGSHHHDPELSRRTYRSTGVIVTALAGLYTGSFLPMLTGDTDSVRYDQPVAIAIAAITFGELGLAIHGTVSARRNSDFLVEAVKLTNLAGGLVLLTLTQSALLSIDPDVEAGNANAISGLVFGSLATAIGGWMIWRSRPSVLRSERSLT